jgi:quercetin dioxygenase-like cupin family protein
MSHDGYTADTTSNIETRIVRYEALKPCLDAFIDTRSPGSDTKENFTIIGPGVSENPNQHVHIAEPHGFNIGGARQPPGCLNSQHSHDTAEVFYVHTGQWRFMSGETGTDGEVFLGPGDIISLPTRMFRGFENVGDAPGFLFAVLGGDDPGRVLWSPYVFDMAGQYGLVLLETGDLIDTAAGQVVPPGKRAMPVTTPAQIAALLTADNSRLAGCVVAADRAQPGGAFDDVAGITERRLIGPAPLDWPHGFSVSELRLAPGSHAPSHRLHVSDVWFVQSGRVRICIDGNETECVAGDTITCPRGAERSVAAMPDTAATLVMVRGGDGEPGIELL